MKSTAITKLGVFWKANRAKIFLHFVIYCKCTAPMFLLVGLCRPDLPPRLVYFGAIAFFGYFIYDAIVIAVKNQNDL